MKSLQLVTQPDKAAGEESARVLFGQFEVQYYRLDLENTLNSMYSLIK